jgi:hypothetical protein
MIPTRPPGLVCPPGHVTIEEGELILLLWAVSFSSKSLVFGGVPFCLLLVIFRGAVS